MSTLYRPGLWLSVVGALIFGYFFQLSKVEIGLLAMWAVISWIAFEVDEIRDASGKSLRDSQAKMIKQIDEGVTASRDAWLYCAMQ